MNENVKCEFANCDEVATTVSWKYPNPYPNPNGIGMIVPQRILINSCNSCDLWNDIRLYGSD